MAVELSFQFVMRPPAAPPALPIPSEETLARSYAQRARAIDARHEAQTTGDVIALRRKYADPVFGEVSPWSLVERMGRCIDPTDQRLFCASQHLHILQIIDAMESEGQASEEMVLAALLHDIGKTLLLTDEKPENIAGMNRPLRTGAHGAGLDQCVFPWSHDELGYLRLRAFLPEGLAWLVRYHSLVPGSFEPCMDARDRDYHERYFRPFSRYDHGSKSPLYLPQRRLEDYRHVVERALPPTIVF